ncbi:MAG TPA: hypothetical protein VJJ20_01710 [Candidatus Paceibacterota bacterium]
MAYPHLVRDTSGQWQQAPDPPKSTALGIVADVVFVTVLVLLFAAERLAMIFGYDPDRGEDD